jgi:serine/threonine protein kinase
MYTLPYQISGSGYGSSVDFWALGVILYEFIIGYPPFTGDSWRDIFALIRAADFTLDFHEDEVDISGILTLVYPNILIEEAKDLITKLLKRNPSERLGAKGILEI